MTGGLTQSETSADRRARARLRDVAGEWFPALAPDVLDQIVAAGWIEGRDTHGEGGEATAVAAAAAVRRIGLRALRGQALDLPADAQERIAGLTAHEAPVAAPPAGRLRRARPEALRRGVGRPPDDDERTRPTAAPALGPAHELEGPPTRRRGARREAPPAPARRPARAKRARPSVTGAVAAAARRPVTAGAHGDRRTVRVFALAPLVAALAVFAVVIGSSLGPSETTTKLAEIHPAAGVSDVVQVARTTSAKTEAAQRAAAARRAAARRHAAARQRAAVAAHRRAAARRHARAVARRRAARRAAARRRALPPPSPVAAPAPTPQPPLSASPTPVRAAPAPPPAKKPSGGGSSSSSGGSTWGGEFGP